MGRFSSGKMNVFDGEHFESEAFDEVEFEGTPETFTVFVPTDMVNLSRIPDEYDYDMETSHNTFFWDELLPTLIVYCLTFVLGLVGNVLIIFTIFRYRKMKSTTNVFLASLASSDLLLILFCIPVKTAFSCVFATVAMFGVSEGIQTQLDSVRSKHEESMERKT